MYHNLAADSATTSSARRGTHGTRTAEYGCHVNRQTLYRVAYLLRVRNKAAVKSATDGLSLNKQLR